MPEHPLRSILAKLVRRADPKGDLEICYAHRGAPNDEIIMEVSAISRLGKGWFGLPDAETQIPYHRVIWVRDVTTGKTYWEKRYPRPSPSQHH